jgi:ribose-phosphate pyrophosphokinase
MLANLLHVAGINHVITIDLHASQMQGFFKCPVDNLHAEPLIARWIRHNVENWREAVCVSKNAGGTKRVTSLADALKLNFGMVTTDRKRGGNMSASMFLDGYGDISKQEEPEQETPELAHNEAAPTTEAEASSGQKDREQASGSSPSPPSKPTELHVPSKKSAPAPSPLRTELAASPKSRSPLNRSQTTPVRTAPIEEEPEYTDERAREVIHGRLIQGHIVEDDYPSPAISAMSNSMMMDPTDEDPMAMSRASSYFIGESHALGGTGDPDALSDEEEEVFQIPDVEQMITLVGNVKDRTVFIVDDMIDKAGSWIAAAETVVKRGGAKKVYCIATHGLFGGDSLQQLQDCDCIDTVVVTNSFPIPADKAQKMTKLVILDLSNLLSEAIRRNHYGESISALFQHIND